MIYTDKSFKINYGSVFPALIKKGKKKNYCEEKKSELWDVNVTIIFL